MATRKKRPLPLSFNLQSNMESHSSLPTQYRSNNSSVLSLSSHDQPGIQAPLINPHSLDHLLGSLNKDTTSGTTSQAAAHNQVAPLDKHVLTALAFRRKPLLSNTFGYSSHSKSPNAESGPYVPNANLSSIFLSISPTSITHTGQSTSSSSQSVAPPVNYHDHNRAPPAPKLPRTPYGPISETRHRSTKEFNILEFLANQRHDEIAYSVPETPSSNSSGVLSDHSSASQLSSSALSVLTVATSHQKECDASTSTRQSTTSTSASPSGNHIRYNRMESAPLPSRLVGWHSLTPSSSFASTLSLASASGRNPKLRPQDLPTSWPIPPSSKSPVAHNGPRKFATYYPLRSFLSKTPGPHPPSHTGTQSSLTLAYLDLSSAPPLPQLLWPPRKQAILTSEPHCYQTTSGASSIAKSDGPLVKPGSSSKHKPRSNRLSVDSDITEGTVYEDAQEKAEWMEVDSGDAYDDLEKTEASARRISQSLTMRNDIGTLNRAVKDPPRKQTLLPKGQSIDSTCNISVLPVARSNYSLPTSRQFSAPVQLTERTSDPPQLVSMSSLNSNHRHDDDHSPPRSRNEAELLTMGSVPLFTRASLARDDREEERGPPKSLRKDQLQRANDDDLRPIQETLESNNLENLSSSKSGLPPSSGNPRRRLKPLILRPVIPTVNPIRARASTQSSKFLSMGSSTDSSSILGSSSPPHLVSQSDCSHAANESIPTRASGETSTPHPSCSLSSHNMVPEEAEIPSSDSCSNEGCLPSSIVSSTDSSTKCRDSNTELLVEVGPHDQGDSNTLEVIHFSEKIDQNGDANCEVPLDTASTKPQPTTNITQPAGRTARVSFATSSRTSTSSDLETPIAGGLGKHKSVSSLNLPTLAAGSLKTGWAHPTATKTQIWSSQRKRNISNLFTSRQTNIDSRTSAVTPNPSLSSPSPSMKKSLDSFLSEDMPAYPQLIISSQKPADRVDNDTRSKGSLNNLNNDGNNTKNDKQRARSRNRLAATLSRMEAQDGKLLDLSPSGNGSLKAKAEKKFVKGKLKRISQPILLSGEEERHALWGMISSAKQLDHVR